MEVQAIPVMVTVREVIWDSCVFISIFQCDPNRKQVLDWYLKELRGRRLKIVASVLAVAEVKHNTQIKPFRKLQKQKNFDLIALDARICERAYALSKNNKLEIPDAIHLATALIHGIPELHSYDDDLLRLDGKVSGLTITEPMINP